MAGEKAGLQAAQKTGQCLLTQPVRRVGGKWLSHADEFDTWLRSFSKAGDELERIVKEVMQNF